MVASAARDESAIADTTDGELNTFMSDAFSRVMMEFLFDGVYNAHRNFKISDMPNVFTFEKTRSHLTMKTTTSRQLDRILLREYLPRDKLEDVLLGKGIDSNQDETKFYNWDDLLIQ